MANNGFNGYTKSKFSAAKALPEGKYTYSVTAMLNGKTETESFPLTIDNQAPEVVKSEVVIQNGKRLWKVTVTDNHYVQAVCATLGSTALTGWYAPNETEEGVESVVTFDLSDPALSGLTQAKIGLVDYADNQTVSDYYDLTGVTVTGFDENDKAVTLLSNIKTASLSVAVRDGNSYDVNQDGKVDQLDITTCQRWYQAQSGDSDWNKASVCDVNGDNKVDIQDMIDILQYLYQS